MVLKTLYLCVKHSLIFLFCVNTEVFVDCFPQHFDKGPVDQTDKAILGPFLESTENNFEAMQKRELLFTLPLPYCSIWSSSKANLELYRCSQAVSTFAAKV